MAILATRKTGNWFLDALRSPDNIFGMGAATSGIKMSTKLIAAGAGVGAVGIASFFGGQKLSQDAALKQTAKTGDYNITAQPGSTVNLNQPATGAISQKETSTQSATQIDAGGISTVLLIVAAIAALSILK